MMFKWLLAAAVIALPLTPACAAPADTSIKLTESAVRARAGSIPRQLDDGQRAGYQAVFASIQAGNWSDAQIELDAMKPGILHPIALAELYTAKGSPKVDRDPLVALLTQAPELPEADQIARLAQLRGATDLPTLPDEHKLNWIPGAPVRGRAHSAGSDAVAAQLSDAMRPFIKNDDGAGAQALLETTQGLSGDSQTEWQARIAWIYYNAGDDANARALALKSAADPSDWGVQASWTVGLASWRQHDCATAANAFASVASRASRRRSARRRALLGRARQHDVRPPRSDPGRADQRGAVSGDVLRPAGTAGAGVAGRTDRGDRCRQR